MNVLSNSGLFKFQEFLESEVLMSIYPSPKSAKIRTKSQSQAPQNLHNDQDLESQGQSTEGNGQRQIFTTAKWPYSVHGVVSFDIQNVRSWGTGILIGPNIVLTAGHNLYDFTRKASANLKRMQFVPGMNGQQLPFCPIEVEKYFVSPNYIEKRLEDYGILILKKSIGEETGYFGLACLEPDELKSKQIKVTGYPRDKVKSKPKTFEMWEMEGVVSTINQEQGEIGYTIHTDPGQSGSGVWYQEGEDYYVCAVHGAENHSTDTGTLVTRDIYNQIYQWALEVSGESIIELKFQDYQINAECLSLLMEYHFNNLSTLDLSSKEIQNKGAKTLAKNTSWANLSQLNLSLNNISHKGARALAQNTSWINLSQLNLRWNHLGHEGARTLAQNTSWINLSQLDLNDNDIGSEGARTLAQNTSWINLSRLDLSDNDIGSEGAKALAQNTSWINLSQLNLSGNDIGNEGAKALAQNTSWINLSQLDLRKNDIGDEGAKALAQNTSWINLSQLSLDQNRIGGEGATALAQISQLKLNVNSLDTEESKGLVQNTSQVGLSQPKLDSNLLRDELIEEICGQNISCSDQTKPNLHEDQIDDKEVEQNKF